MPSNRVGDCAYARRDDDGNGYDARRAGPSGWASIRKWDHSPSMGKTFPLSWLSLQRARGRSQKYRKGLPASSWHVVEFTASNSMPPLVPFRLKLSPRRRRRQSVTTDIPGTQGHHASADQPMATRPHSAEVPLYIHSSHQYIRKQLKYLLFLHPSMPVNNRAQLSCEMNRNRQDGRFRTRIADLKARFSSLGDFPRLCQRHPS